mgnify:CR=1 FL=1
MNDFTKDELEEIKGSLHRDVFSSNTISNKIQSLIDNYCEHKHTTTDSAMVEFCIDCNWLRFE